MALITTASEFRYSSESGGIAYTFAITVDQNGNCSVRDIKTPTGLLCDPFTPLPASVLDDIQTAKSQVETLLAQTSAVNGIVTFTSQTTASVVFATAFANDTYGVSFTVDDFIPVKATNKTTTGFTIETGITFTGDIRFDVFV